MLVLGNWYDLMPKVSAHASLAAIALICSLIIGVERFRKEKPVGFRTLGLVSFGACTYVMVAHAISPSEGPRVIGQIVSGIGFLGAGVILRGQYGVTGLTSAATIWAMAGIGSAAGAGYGGGALAAASLMWLLLTVASRLERLVFLHNACAEAVVRYETRQGKAQLRIEEVLDDFHIAPMDQTWSCTLDHGVSEVRLRYHHLHRHHRECLARLAELPEVISIDRDEERVADRFNK